MLARNDGQSGSLFRFFGQRNWRGVLEHLDRRETRTRDQRTLGDKMKKIEDPNSTTMTVRLSVESKEMWKRLAERDHRTVANYLDCLLKRIEQKDFCLADVMDQLDVIKEMLKPKARKPRTVSGPPPKKLRYGGSEVVSPSALP